MTTAIGFDLDNTLYDQEQHVLPFFSAAAAQLGYETSLDPLLLETTFRNEWKALGPSHPKLFNIVLERHGICNQQRVRNLVEMYHSCVGPLEVYPGVDTVLERLSGRFALFLVTDGNAAMQRRKIERLGIGPLFRVVVLSAELGLAKPDSESFLSAVRRLDHQPANCIFVGDNPKCDIVGGAYAGMRTVRVLTGPFRADACAEIEPDFTIDSVADIEKVLIQ
jgi:HAD superfamily hydrolase (TIGR01549 family)